MRGDAPSAVWRIDIAVQRSLRDSTLQASAPLQATRAAMNWWGGPGVIWFAAALWLGGRALGKYAISRAGLRGAEALAIASAVSGIIKGFAGRARPFVHPGEPWHFEFNHGWSDARFFSMPSGHTTATMAFALGVLLATSAWPAGKRVGLTIPLLLSAALVAFARMYSDQHWMSDVLVALTIGSAAAFVLSRAHENRAPSGYDRVMLGDAASTVAK